MDLKELKQITESLELEIDILKKRVKELEDINSCKKNTPFDDLTVPQVIETYENLRRDMKKFVKEED